MPQLKVEGEEILFSHQKEGTSAICDNTDGLWGPYARNNTDREKNTA